MTGHAKYKSRSSDRSFSRQKKKKSRKRSTSGCTDRVAPTSQRNSSSKEKKKKPQKRKHQRRSSSSSSSSDSSIERIKADSKLRQLLGDPQKFSRNRAGFSTKDSGESLHKNHAFVAQESKRSIQERCNNIDLKKRFPLIERRDRCPSMSTEERGRKRTEKDCLVHKKSNKSYKRRRSSSQSSSSSSSSSSSESSSSSSSSSRSSSSSSSSCSSSSSSSNSSYERKKKRRKKKKFVKKMKHAEQKKREQKKKKLKKIKGRLTEPIKETTDTNAQDRLLKDINVELAGRAKAMAPMTREEWEKKQSVIRKVYDEETGRHRLIKGDGEVLEEIVSRDRHMQINRQATKGDGEFFQSRLRVNK